MMTLAMVMTCAESVLAAGSAGTDIIDEAEISLNSADDAEMEEIIQDPGEVPLSPAEDTDEPDIESLIDTEPVAVENEDLTRLGDGEHKHCVCCSADSCGDDHNADQVWTAWESTTALPTEVDEGSGKKYYYLTGDVILNDTYTADDGLFLCLNGHTVTMNNYSYNCEGTLTVTNCAEKDPESGVRAGGFVQGESEYTSKYMIKSRNLNLYYTSLTATDVSHTYYLIGHDAASGDDLPDYYIEDCLLAYEETGRSSAAAVKLNAANNVSIKDTKITGSSGFIVTEGLTVADIRGKLDLSGTDIILNTNISYSSGHSGTFTYPVTITSSEGAKTHQISNSTIGITDTYQNSVDICAVKLMGTGEYELTDCTISASETGTGDCTGISLGSGSTVVLDDCAVTATNVTENGNGTVYAVYKEGSMSVLNGSEVTATTNRNANAYGIFSRSSDAAHTLNVVDSSVTGREYGIYLNTTNQAGAQTVNIKDSEIEATLATPYIGSDSAKGVGIYHYPYWNDYNTIYLGGDTEVKGVSFSFNVGRTSTNSSVVDHFIPRLYARSTDGTVLSDDGEKITLYCDRYKDYIQTGDIIILEGMSEGLAEKVELIYPDTCYLGTDGKAVKKQLYYIETMGPGNFTGCEDYDIYVDEDCETEVWKKYSNNRVYEGVKIYLKAVPKTHYVFDKWKITHRVNNNNAEYGEGELLDKALTVNENSFTMPANAIEVRPSFKEAPSHLITYHGGAQSDGSVADFTGKKYDGEDTELSRNTFKNKGYKTQTGWSLTDGGELDFALGAVCQDDTINDLYPYWEANHTITLKYGVLAPEGHTADEVAATLPKLPGRDYRFDWEEELLFGYESGGTASSPYHYTVDESGHYWKLYGLSTSPEGTSQDYVFYTQSGSEKNLYKEEADITLYPYWERLYCISFANGDYGYERDEPLSPLFVSPGRSVTLPGRIDSDGNKTGAYESTREWYKQGGWSVNEDGHTKDYELAGSYTAASGADSEDVILYPYWETINRITYSPGADGTDPNGVGEIVVKKYKGVTRYISYGLFIRQGYTQTKWSTEEGGSGTFYNFNSSYNSNNDLTLYPVWEANHTVTYVPDDKCDQTASVKDTKIPGTSVKIRGNVFTAKGYTLLGYTETEGGTNAEYSVGDTYSTEADLTLYPVWQAETYGLWVGGTQVTSDNKDDILGDNKVSFDPDTQTLTLNGADITTAYDLEGSKVGIFATGYENPADHPLKKLNLKLEGDNTIAPALTGSGYGIYSDLQVTVSGSGSLTVGKNDAAYMMMAAVSAESFRMTGAELNLYGQMAGLLVEPGAYVEGVVIDGGTFNSTAVADGGVALGVDARYDDNYAAAVRISGGTVNLTTTGGVGSNGGQDIYPSAIAARVSYSDGIIFEGGTVTLTNTGSAGYGLELSYSYEEGEMDEPAFYGVRFYTGTVTINSVNGTIVEEQLYPIYTSVYVGDGVTVSAGGNAAGAVAITDFATQYSTYKYAGFTGGTVPEKEYLFIGNERVTSNNLEGEGWSYDPATATLTITDIELDTIYNDGYTYGIYAPGDLNLIVEGNSSVGMTGAIPETGIYARGNLTISGSGYLEVFGSDEALSAGSDVVINSSTIDAVSDAVAIYPYGDIRINGGKVNAVSTGKDTARYSRGMLADNLFVKGGEVTASGKDEGINTSYDVNISGGKVSVESEETALHCEDNYIQSGGTVSFISTNTGNDKTDRYALFIEDNMSVSGGSLYAESQYIAIKARYVNKTLTLDGGQIKVRSRSATRHSSGTTMTVIYQNVIINGGSLDISGYGYGMYSGKSGTNLNVIFNGGSILINMLESRDDTVNYAIRGKITVNAPSSRYCNERGGRYQIRTGSSYTINCMASSGYEGTDFVCVTGTRVVSYRPGEHGSGDPLDELNTGGEYILKDAIYTYDGHIQDGWSLTDGGEKEYEFGASYSQDADLLLYPHWAEVEYTVTYKPGANSKEETEYADPVATDGNVKFRNVTYTRDDYVQIGWSSSDSAEEVEYELGEQGTINSSLTLYPVFSNAIKITYDKGSRGKGENVTVDADISGQITLEDAIFTRAGYKQTGWALTDGGNKEYDLKQRTSFAADTVLYPVWAREYKLNYLPGRAPGSGSVVPLYEDGNRYSIIIEPGVDIELDRAMFRYVPAAGEQAKVQSGWSLTDGSFEADYEFGESVIFDDTTVLYPVWATDGFRVVFTDADDVVRVQGSEQKIYIEDYTGTAIKPVIEVYDGDILLTEKVDYTIAIKNNTNAEMTAAILAGQGKLVTDPASGLNEKDLKKLPYVTITGKGNYSEKQDVYFSIRPMNIKDAGFAATGSFTYQYAKKGNKVTVNSPVPAVSGMLNGKAKKLANKKEFTVKYYQASLSGGNYRYDGDGLLMYTGAAIEGGIGATGKYVIVAEGTGNFSGKLTAKAEVTNKKLLSKVKVTYDKTITVPYNWNNTAVTQQNLKLTDGKEDLRASDYSVNYSDNTRIGTATMTITAKNSGNYAGEVTYTYKIAGQNLSKAKMEGFTASMDYDVYRDGGYMQDALSFKFVKGKNDEVLLTKDTHYTVEYMNNDLPGTATMICTGLGAFEGTSVKKTFKINGTPTGKITVNNYPKDAFEYNGAPQILETSDEVSADKVYLTYRASKDDDPVVVPFLTKARYEEHENGVYIRYITDPSVKGNNINAGTANIELVGSGIWTGVIKKSFKINPFDMQANTDGRLSFEYAAYAGDDPEVPYEKGGAAPAVKVTFESADGTTVTLDASSMKVSYKNNAAENNGSNDKKRPTVQIDGKGNFKGSHLMYFRIVKSAITADMITADDKAWSDKADNYLTTVTVTDTNGKKLAAGTDYEKAVVFKYGQEVAGVMNKTRAADKNEGDEAVKGDKLPQPQDGGTKMFVVIKGCGNYKDDEISVEYYVRSGDLSKAVVVYNKTFYYNRGREVNPTKNDFDLVLNPGKPTQEIIPSEDYEIVEGSYVNNTGKGTARFKIKGKNNRAGIIAAKYSIVPKSVR